MKGGFRAYTGMIQAKPLIPNPGSMEVVYRAPRFRVRVECLLAKRTVLRTGLTSNSQQLKGPTFRIVKFTQGYRNAYHISTSIFTIVIIVVILVVFS